jgi:Flp pilus assembly protein TadB
LHYAVSGQPGVPFFYTAFNVSWLLLITFLLGSFIFSPTIGGNWIGVLLLFVLLATLMLYVWYSYRSYQGHLKELSRFMQEFAQRLD